MVTTLVAAAAAAPYSHVSLEIGTAGVGLDAGMTWSVCRNLALGPGISARSSGPVVEWLAPIELGALALLPAAGVGWDVFDETAFLHLRADAVFESALLPVLLDHRARIHRLGAVDALFVRDAVLVRTGAVATGIGVSHDQRGDVTTTAFGPELRVGDDDAAAGIFAGLPTYRAPEDVVVVVRAELSIRL